MGEKLTDVAGGLLAGGRSTRMGTDKRFLQVGGRALFERSLSVLESLFEEVLVSVAEPLPSRVVVPHRTVTDLIPDRAALGGLYTLLTEARAPRVFVVACDMPFLNPAVVRYLVARDPAADLVMVQLASGLQPMQGVYAKSCLPHLERMGRKGELRLQSLAGAAGLRVRLVGEEELRSVDPQLRSFLNVNTPADLEFARKLAAAGERGSGPV